MTKPHRIVPAVDFHRFLPAEKALGLPADEKNSLLPCGHLEGAWLGALFTAEPHAGD
jgi:hypothetical protein